MVLSSVLPAAVRPSGPLVDAYIDDNLTIWTLWARPRGEGGSRARAAAIPGGGREGFGCVCSYGSVSIDAVHHHTIDEVRVVFFFFFTFQSAFDTVSVPYFMCTLLYSPEWYVSEVCFVAVEAHRCTDVTDG